MSDKIYEFRNLLYSNEREKVLKFIDCYEDSPVKTSCQSFVLTDDADVMKTRHDCRKCPNTNCRMRNIWDKNDESRFEILGSDTTDINLEDLTEEEYDIAIDIGTTTIAMSLIGVWSKQILHTVTAVNSQRKYGADVVFRIQASVEGKKEELKTCIRTDLSKGIHKLLDKAGVQRKEVRHITISGNTTMIHLLMGYDCQSLGVFPYTPVNIDFIQKDNVTILPGISAYVGGDIVSGMYECGFDQTDDICMLVDLGTNGEIALGNKERILVTSTAAGPAFEGGNITWGTGSIAGAICSVELDGTRPKIQTIFGQAPTGICGTGVVETTAELLRTELMDETGMLDEEYFDDGFPLALTAEGREIVFTQKDIREVQLAKAAVRAGIETLVLRYGIQKEEVKKVYIAGGFGYKLNIKRAIEIGMLPEEFKGKTEAVGNSSLKGAERYSGDKNGERSLRDLISVSKEVGLATDKDFQKFYMDGMYFSGR